MTDKFKIDFNNNISTWNELSFEKSGNNLSFPKINIIMNVYYEDLIIYSSKFYIEGIYSCCGSLNFEFDEIKLDIIKDCDNKTKNLIINEIEKKCNDIENMLNGTILDIWKERIYEYIYESLW
jgi:hypothetical protein